MGSWILGTVKCPECCGFVEAMTNRARIEPNSSFIASKAGQVNMPAECLDCDKRYTLRVCQSPLDIVLLES